MARRAAVRAPRRNNPVIAVKRQVGRLRTSLRGHMWNCPVDPEPIDLRPWYPARVDFNIPTGGTSLYFTARDIIDKLYDQGGLGAQSKDNTNIKVKGVRAWCTAAGPSTQRPTVNMDVGTLFTASGDPATPGPAEIFYAKRKVVRDNGSLSNPARIGWKWSLADSDMPLNYNTVFSLVEVAGNLDNATLRFYIQWSITGVADPIAVMSYRVYMALRLEGENEPSEFDDDEEPPQLVPAELHIDAKDIVDKIYEQEAPSIEVI